MIISRISQEEALQHREEQEGAGHRSEEASKFFGSTRPSQGGEVPTAPQPTFEAAEEGQERDERDRDRNRDRAPRSNSPAGAEAGDGDGEGERREEGGGQVEARVERCQQVSMS